MRRVRPNRKTPTRLAEFKAAAALAETTVVDWCEEEGVTPSHFYQVIKGHRSSAPLSTKIDRFIARHLPDHVAA